MRWGGIYFPNDKDLVSLTNEENEAIYKAVEALRDADLPHAFYDKVENVKFYSDPTLTGSAILGQTNFFQPNRVILSPVIVQGLTWTNNKGVPNNEIHMATVIHELTHLQQFRDWKWYGWIIVHLPFLNKYTVERWATQNGDASDKYLGDLYSSMKKEYILDQKK